MEEIKDRDEVGFELPKGGISNSLVVGDSNFEEIEIEHEHELHKMATEHEIKKSSETDVIHLANGDEIKIFSHSSNSKNPGLKNQGFHDRPNRPATPC